MAATEKKVGTLLDGYIKADSRNLPKVDILMVISFFNDSTDHIQPGCEHQKLQRSKGENYSSDAVGYVQLKRDLSKTCTVKARVTPENRVNAKPYAVSVVIDEGQQTVSSAQCADCVAAAGGCKHVAALLGWLSARSSEVAVTSTESYWKKARLSCVPSILKTAGAKHLRPNKRKSVVEDTNSGRGAAFLASVLEMEKEVSQPCLLFDHLGSTSKSGALDGIGMDQLLNDYLSNVGTSYCYEGFVNFASKVMTAEKCEAVKEATVEQSECRLWRSVRFGRVTASKAYEVAHCATEDGTLVASIMGASKVKDNAALKRGRLLEPQVVKVAEKDLGPITKSGIVLKPQYPIFGASPDGVTTGGAIVEVKCPTGSRTRKNYISEDGAVGSKPFAQLQLLMRMAGTNSSYLCVADPDFESSGEVQIIPVPIDDVYCDLLIANCVRFWSRTVFVQLCEQYLAIMAA